MGNSVAIQEYHKELMLFKSIGTISEMEPIAAALRTKDADDRTWEYVSPTLIDEHNNKHEPPTKSGRRFKLKRTRKGPNLHDDSITYDEGTIPDESADIQVAALALDAALQGTDIRDKEVKKSVTCQFCDKSGHFESSCYLKPDNPYNRFPPKLKERMMVIDGTKTKRAVKTEEPNNKAKKIELAGI